MVMDSAGDLSQSLAIYLLYINNLNQNINNFFFQIYIDVIGNISVEADVSLAGNIISFLSSLVRFWPSPSV